MIAASPKLKRGRGVTGWRRGVRTRERETERQGGREGGGEAQSTLPLAFLCLVRLKKGGGAVGLSVCRVGQWGEGMEEEGGRVWAARVRFKMSIRGFI